MTPTYSMRPFQPGADLEDAIGLYMRHGGSFLRVPDPNDLLEAGEDGTLFVVTDEDAGRQSRMCGVAGLFRAATCEGIGQPGPVEVYKMTGMVLAPILRGYGLHRVLLALRSLALAHQVATGAALLASVIAGNKASLASVMSGGFIQCETPGWLRVSHRFWNLGQAELIPTRRSVDPLAFRLSARREAAGTRSRLPQAGIIDTVLPPRALQNHARLLLDALSNPIYRCNADDGRPATIRLDLGVGWVTDDPGTLLDCAAGRVPAWEETIPQTRLLGRPPDWIRFRPHI